ncbi:MAG: serine aminopeptidase domain-containing protein, partial [Pirellula sp.]
MQAFLHAVASSSQQEVVFDRGGKSEGSYRYVHRWWPKDTEHWGAITLVHGFGDHSGRFDGMATSLASYGLAVTAIDLIGHGRSPGRRGVIDSYEQLIDEVDMSVELS